MGTFKILINEVRSQSDKERRFLIDHGIDPKALHIPMYYPDKNCNVVLQGPGDDSPWFKDEKISPKDKVIVKKVFEKYVQPGEENNTGNFYRKEKNQEIFELTVDEYKEKILGNPENEETQQDMKFADLDTGEFLIDKVKIIEPGKNYTVGDQLILPCDKGDAVLKVINTNPEGGIVEVEVIQPGYSTIKTDDKLDLTFDQYHKTNGTGAKVSIVGTKDKGIAQAISDLKQYRDDKKYKQNAEFEKFANLLTHIGSGKLLNDLDIPENGEGVNFKALSANTKSAIEKLKTLHKLGVDMNDEYAYFIVWEAKNHLILDAIKEKIKEIKSEKERDDVKQAFKKQKKEWFRSNLDPKEVISIANKWWKSLGLSPLTKKQNESTLTEVGSTNYLSYTDAKIDHYLDELFGNNGKRFKTVPIINNPYNPDDPDADPVEYLLIRGIDTSNLGPNGKVRVGKTDANGARVYETYEMNISELQDIVNRQENRNTTLDTDKYRRLAGNQFTTLNPGYGGKYVKLPEEVIMQMLETMQNDEEGNYRYDYTMIDLVKKYQEELKDPSKHCDIVLMALQDYNGYDYRQYQIKYNPSKQVYEGLMEYEGHITAPISHIWRG